ncbi:MAG: hypothetical protein GYB66_13655, partial [Chloroflexi bacterium]|nr:hypothetical protein [Chloroflexota bacterium]
MIRTVPDTGTEEIELYMRTYYSLLRTTDAIKIQALVESHKTVDSSLHIHARDSQVDISALVYATLRLPVEITQVRLVVLGQIEKDFPRAGYENVERWERVHAIARRRRTHFDGDSTLAVMIASRSDIDDIIPILTALQIEWNKVHSIFHASPAAQRYLSTAIEQGSIDANTLIGLARELGIDVAEFSRLQRAWQQHDLTYFEAIAAHPLDLSLQLLAGSQTNYRKAASRWWANLSRTADSCGTMIQERPVYFVSSNSHAIANLTSGYTTAVREDMLSFMHQTKNKDLQAEWQTLQAETTPGSVANRQNFFYYLLKKYNTAHPESIQRMYRAEQEIGMTRVFAVHGFDVEAQVFCLDQIDPARLDARVTQGLDVAQLAASDALIVNIDYPLGLAAFELLTRVAEGCDRMLGIYVMGKAATLNGRIGDVMLSNVVHDEHSDNSYLFDNCFRASDISPYLVYGTLLDNQKAIAARGTFLQNRTYMDVFYREGYTIIEMEAGPYLSAVYEMIRPVRHPYNEIINLYPAPFEVGLIHYASDTPYSRGHNLGAGSLGYHGVDSTYAASIAILRRIFAQEIRRQEA